jgi:hypothetical protein
VRNVFFKLRDCVLILALGRSGAVMGTIHCTHHGGNSSEFPSVELFNPDQVRSAESNHRTQMMIEIFPSQKHHSPSSNGDILSKITFSSQEP